MIVDNNPKRPIGKEIEKLQKLVDQGIISVVMGIEYDDTYAVDYASDHQGIVVSNDYYRDYFERRVDEEDEEKTNYFEIFVRTRTLRYTFVRGEFLPSDDFQWPEIFDLET